jgi:O-antigen/teichoic acid export membrane protein
MTGTLAQKVVVRNPYKGLFNGIAVMTAGKGILVVLGFVNKVLLAKIMNPESLGLFGLTLSIFGLTFMMANMGAHNAHVYNIVRNRISVARSFGFSIVFATITGLIGACLLYLIYISWLDGLYFKSITISSSVMLVYFFLFIPSNIIKTHLVEILIGLKKFKIHNGFMIVESVLFLMILASLYSVVGGGLFVGLTAWTSSVFIVSIGLIAYILHQYGVMFSSVINDAKIILPYGLKCFSAGLFQSLMVRFDILLVAFFLDATITGTYYLAASLSVSLNSITIPLNRVVYTYLCNLKLNEGIQLTNRAFKMSLYSGLSLLVVFIPIIIKTIPFIFGELYSQSGQVQKVL